MKGLESRRMFLVTNSLYSSDMSNINKYENVVIIPGFPGCGVFTLSVLEHPRGEGQCGVPGAGPGLLLASSDHEIVWSLARLKLI